MISFEEVWKFTEPLPGIYSKAEVHELYKLVAGLRDHATIVEIGVLYGRSASVYFQVAKAGKPLDIHLIDPWVVSEGDTYKAFHGMVDQHFRNIPFTMHNHTSDSVLPYSFYDIDLLHIDGDHSPQGIRSDCNRWVGGVTRPGGYVVFHDYDTRGVPGHAQEDGGLVFPQIKATVDAHCRQPQWEHVGMFDTLLVVRKR